MHFSLQSPKENAQDCHPTSIKGNLETSSRMHMCVDPEKKDSFDVNPKKEFVCSDGITMVNQGPKFYE